MFNSVIVFVLVLFGGLFVERSVGAENVINLLTDCSHEYSFNLSDANRNQAEVYPGINCLTSCRTIYKTNLKPINSLVVMMDGRLPYLEPVP